MNIKVHYSKAPIVLGITFGLTIIIVMMAIQFLFVKLGIDIGLVGDSFIRIGTGIVALFIMKMINDEEFSKLFTVKIPSFTWMILIPVFLWLITECLKATVVTSFSNRYPVHFLKLSFQQVATGFVEEAVSKGIIMSGMLLCWKNTVKGRIAAVFLNGCIFGSLHFCNMLFGYPVIDTLWSVLYTSCFGVMMSTVYLCCGNITLCMAIHAVWDIIVRLPEGFYDGILTDTPMNTFISTTEDILQLGVFPVISLIVCIVYKHSKSDYTA